MSKTKRFSLRRGQKGACLRDFHGWRDLKNDITHFVFIIVTLKVNDGDPEHAALLPSTEREKKLRSGELILLNDTHPIYCSVLLNFLARYLAEALLGILTMDSSLP